MTTIPAPQKKPILKRWWFWLIAIIVVIILLSAIGGASSYQQFLESQYSYLEESVEVEKRTVEKTVSATGTLIPEQSTVLGGATGSVEDVNVAVGDSVSKDDVLLTVDTGFGSTDIVAPYDGKVIALYTFAGDAVNAGTPLIEVGYNSSVVEFLASDSEVILLEQGQKATLTVPAYQDGDEEFEAEVKFVDIKKQSGGATATGIVGETGYVVRVSTDNLPEDIRGILGLTVDMSILIEQVEDVPAVVAGAIQYDDEKPFVYAVPNITDEFIVKAMQAEDVTDILDKEYISVGLAGDEFVEIESGLKEGDKVLLFVPTSVSQFGF